MGRYFEEFVEGQEFVTRARTVTEADVVGFAGLSGDFNQLHTDAEFMKESQFGERVAHGMLVASLSTGLSSQMGWFDGTTVALMETTFRFRAPVRFGDTVHMVMRVKDRRTTSKADRGVVVMEANVLNQRGEMVVEGVWTMMMRRKPS